MARRASEIAVQFKRPPGILFSEDEKFDVSPNTMVIRIQPDEGVTLVLNSKVKSWETRTQPVKMHFSLRRNLRLNMEAVRAPDTRCDGG